MKNRRQEHEKIARLSRGLRGEDFGGGDPPPAFPSRKFFENISLFSRFFVEHRSKRLVNEH